MITKITTTMTSHPLPPVAAGGTLEQQTTNQANHTSAMGAEAMTTITNKGRNLADRINPSHGHGRKYGFHPELGERCSLIVRHAVTLHRLYEDECNGHPSMGQPSVPIELANKLQERWDARIERETERLEKRIAELANGLPNIRGVEFNGDPRGAPVRLVTMDGSGDSWADPRGWCVGSYMDR